MPRLKSRAGLITLNVDIETISRKDKDASESKYMLNFV